MEELMGDFAFIVAKHDMVAGAVHDTFALLNDLTTKHLEAVEGREILKQLSAVVKRGDQTTADMFRVIAKVARTNTARLKAMDE